ncbi:MAG: hypothetical protein M1818_006080 [Claussenomyces sp. TS43310]|nr:MAG: hypothetical protein M1818_006080 [Claussenomyces sp. TS43310]
MKDQVRRTPSLLSLATSVLRLHKVPEITIHCVRHAQGFHNLNVAGHQLPDPDLTELGQSQSKELQKSFPYHDRVTHLVASPLRRTIYTCLLGFGNPIKEKSRKVIALPELQEISDLPCDTGSDPDKLLAEFSTGAWANSVDLSLVKDGWNDKSASSPWAPAAPKIEARAKAARKWLRELGHKSGKPADIVLVTHGGFLHYFTEDWVGHEKFLGTGWANTEFRSYVFRYENDENASLIETPESCERRRGHNQPLTETEQQQLRIVAQKTWQNSGLQDPGSNL